MRPVHKGFRIALPALVAFGVGCAGDPGPAGTGCTLTNNPDAGTSVIRCGDGTTVTLHNGTDGTNGANGTNGTNGTNGNNGTACTLTTNDAGLRVITCGEMSITVANGADGTNATCTVSTNMDSGARTITCSDGTTTTLTNGTNGAPGQDGLGVRITDRHGSEHLLSTGEYANGNKVFAIMAITGATADASGVVTVNFRVEDRAHHAITNVASASATIAKLVPASRTENTNHWVPYIYTTETVTTAGAWPSPVGTMALQATRDTGGTLTNNHDGTYSYRLRNNLSTAMAGTTPVTYDRALTHRVAIMIGGHAGPTADAFFDFVPNGGAITERRDIVETATCQQCHGETEFHAHGGDRMHVETCATCHVAGTADAQSGNTLDLQVMVHKIHSGGELASIPGPDGILWDNPATTVNEAADNGTYAIWGYGNTRHSWEHVGFPAIISNCQKCHQGSGAQVLNWQQRPNRAACGSCHDNVNFTTGANHAGGARTDDTGCSVCHTATTGTPPVTPIVGSHDWLAGDPRVLPEFNATLTLTPPANGRFYVAGEAPVVSIALRDRVTGNLVDHTTLAEDPTAEGCLPPPGMCPPRDGLLRSASFFVHGPRNHRMPVLTTAARSQMFSATTGPWDLSATGASLIVQFDQGVDMHARDASGGDLLKPGTVTVTVASAASGTFPTLTAATPAQVVAWLNGNANFRNRGIAWVDTTGRVGIRSRNLGMVHSIQLQASAVTTAVFGGDVVAHMPTGSTNSNNVSRRTVTANQDPKVTYTTGAIQYQLDPVDDLEPGTYIVSIEFNDRGSVDSVSNYNAPTTARVTFQVGTATEERPPAGNCDSCHEGPDGRGYVLDFVRHFKIFNDSAVDQCGACHDYQPQTATGTIFPGAVPISRRVHAVHYGSSLNYPNATVSHADTIAGRNWNITFPQDVRNCQTCHQEGTTSGVWANTPNRLACGGCHDSDAASAHLRLMTFDPTPSAPWSGDEQESCATCH